MAGIVDRLIDEMPVAIVDLETTGLYAGGDRIVELAVVRIEPGHHPVVAIDTLVNPRRPMAATEIHGITDADVADAPTFEHIADAFVSALAGCVLASYNVYFDVKFIQAEWGTVGGRRFPPRMPRRSVAERVREVQTRAAEIRPQMTAAVARQKRLAAAVREELKRRPRRSPGGFPTRFRTP